MPPLNNNDIKVLAELAAIRNVCERLDTKHDNFEKATKERFERMEIVVEDNNRLIRGDSEPAKGLYSRVLKLEDDSRRRVWLIRACIGFCAATLSYVIAEYLHK